MTDLVVGARGQLGAELLARLPDGTVGWGRDELDISCAEVVLARLAELRPQRVFNCAAYNLVDQAEDEPQAAYQVNSLGPRNLAAACSRLGATLVHVSSDYVFGLDPSRQQPWTEEDAPGPQGAYAVSKLAGEYFARSGSDRHFVVRTCGLYGERSEGQKGNFIRTMLKLGETRDVLRVVADQHCTPTSTADLADALVELAATDAFGVYHATNAGATTWHELASFVLELAGFQVDVQAISTAEFGARAPRPRYSVLDCGKLSSILGRTLPDWREAARRYVQQTLS